MRQTPDRRYALGFRLLPLGTAGERDGRRPATERVLGGLVDALGETANLAMLDGDQVAYVAQVPGRHSMRMFTEVGRRVDLHCTAVGKAVLSAAFDDDVRRAVVARTGLPRRHRDTLTDIDVFLAQLAEVRAAATRSTRASRRSASAASRCGVPAVVRAPGALRLRARPRG